MTTTLERGLATSLDQDVSRPVTTGRAGASRWLVRGGVPAGPLFVVASVAHAAVRDGAAFLDHPPSALSNGDFGWVQITTFVVAGLLLAGAALALRGRLCGAGSVWGPRLIGAFGVGLIGGGVLRMDPGFGFPAGTPAGKPDEVTWHGAAQGWSSLSRSSPSWLDASSSPAIPVAAPSGAALAIPRHRPRRARAHGVTELRRARRAVRAALARRHRKPRLDQRRDRRRTTRPDVWHDFTPLNRIPRLFVAVIPHNRSVKAPDGQAAAAGPRRSSVGG